MFREMDVRAALSRLYGNWTERVLYGIEQNSRRFGERSGEASPGALALFCPRRRRKKYAFREMDVQAAQVLRAAHDQDRVV